MRRKTDYSNQKQYRQRKHQWKKNNQKTKMGRKTLLCTIQAINKQNLCCLIFWDEACWFLSLRVFGLLSSSLLLFPQRFGWYVLQPFSGICRTRELSRNFKARLLLNSRESPVMIPLAITGYKCKVFLYCYSPLVRIEPETSKWLSP